MAGVVEPSIRKETGWCHHSPGHSAGEVCRTVKPFPAQSRTRIGQECLKYPIFPFCISLLLSLSFNCFSLFSTTTPSMIIVLPVTPAHHTTNIVSNHTAVPFNFNSSVLPLPLLQHCIEHLVPTSLNRHRASSDSTPTRADLITRCITDVRAALLTLTPRNLTPSISNDAATIIDHINRAAHEHHDKYAHNPNRCSAALLSLAPLHPETAAVFYSNSKLGRAALHRTVIA